MADLQTRTAKALGRVTKFGDGVLRYKSPDDWCKDWRLVEWDDIKPDSAILDLPDPADPRVYEEVIGKVDGDQLSRSLAEVLEIDLDNITMDNYYAMLDRFVSATPERRLEAALRVLEQ